MVATDGDDEVLQLLGINTKHNAPSCQVEKLFWGCVEPLAALELKEFPDFVLAANVLYDLEAWDALVQTIKELSGSDTLVVFASMFRPTKDDRPFFEQLSKA